MGPLRTLRDLRRSPLRPFRDPAVLNLSAVAMLHKHGLPGDYKRLVCAVTLACIPCTLVGSSLLVMTALLVGLVMMTRSPVPGPLLLTLV